MALPTISHNTPSAGSISWTAFGIQYNGQAYSIPAGSTSNSFVWWLYNAGAPALQQGNALPELGPDDMILFLNKSGTGVLVPTAEMMDGSLIVGGSILAGAIGANQIQTTHLSANAVTADIIAANAIVTKHLSAGAITADKLSVGTVSDNMVVNGSFEDALSGTLVGWEVSAMSNGTITPVTGQSSSGAVSMQLAATTTAANLRFRQLPAQYIPVSAASGRKYYISTRAGASVATTSGHYMRVNWYDANKAFISLTDIRSNAALTTTFTLYEGQATPPATAKYMAMEVIVTNVNVVTTVYIDEISAHEVTMAAQIGDGQITAAKIVGNTITGNQIAANTIYADKLAISDFSNWLGNGGFNMGSTFLDNWAAGVGVAVADTNFVSGRALQNTAVGSYGSRYQTKVFAAEEGDQFFLSAKVKCTVGTGAVLPTLRVLFRDRAGVNISGGNMGTATGTVDGNYVTKETVCTAPAGTAQVTLWIEMHNPNGLTQTIGDCIVRRMNGGELIVDGAIYASKIATDAVTTDKLIANAITGIKIAANAITAEKISANAVSAVHILGGSITAGKLQVGSGINALADPSFSNADLTTARLARGTGGTWTLDAATVSGIPSVSHLTTTNNDKFFWHTPAPTATTAINSIPCAAGQKWILEVEVETDIACGVRWNYYKHNADGSMADTTMSGFNPVRPGTAVTTTGKRLVSYTWTVPAGVVAFAPYVAFGATGTNVKVYGNAVVTRQAHSVMIEDGTITANKLETELVLASKIIAGDPARTHSEMSPDGFRVFTRDPNETDPLVLPQEAIRLGVDSTDDYFAVLKADGTSVASINEDGVGAFSQVNAASGLFYKGEELTTILDRKGRGIVGSAYRTTNSAQNAYVGGPWNPYLRFEAVLHPGRLYKVWTSSMRIDTDVNVGSAIKISYKLGGLASVTDASPLTSAYSPAGPMGGRRANTMQELFALQGSTSETVSFLLSYAVSDLYGGASSGQAGMRASAAEPIRFVCEDIGPVINAGTGVWLDGNAPPAPAKNTYVTQYGCTGSMNYQGSNAQYNFDTGRMYQGLSPAGYGNLKSIGIFGDMTADLSGATINYVRVYFNFPHWYYNNGGQARIGVHGHTGIPGTYSSVGPLSAISSGWPKPGARWVDLSSSHWDGFRTGAYRGVYLEGDSTYGTYGYADRPTIEISYTK